MASFHPKRVVVTGMGMVTPFGLGKELLWEAIREGKSAADKITLFDASDLPCQIAAEVRELPSPAFLPAKEQRRSQRLVLMALLAAEDALKDSGLDPSSLSLDERRRMGVILGTGAGGVEFAERQYKTFYAEGPRRVSPFAIVASIAGMLSSELSMAYDLRGMSQVISTGCTSSTDAVGYALSVIRQGYLDRVVAGGAEACITPGVMAAFCQMGAVATRWNGDPQRASRPFTKNRDGFVLAEGAFLLILEELEMALARGARLYGEVAGYGSTCDAYHRVAIMPSGEESARAMALALQDARIGPEQIDYISLHGTSTLINDVIETQAVKALFDNRAYRIPGSSLKSMLGHPQGACGAAGIAAALLSMQHQFITPTINYDEPDPSCDLDYVPNQGRPSQVKVALCNCIGFGSKNSALVLKNLDL